MEVWDLYDANKNVTGKYCIRGEKIPDNYYHLVVHIWIKNDKGEYLISQRSEKKDRYPLMWECSGGAVIKGETSIEGAIREVKEEVGIDLEEKNGRMVFSKIREFHNGEKFNDIMDVWLFEYNGDVDLKNATTDEVNDFKWMKKEEIRKMYETKQLVPTLEYFFEKIEY